jgi:hypothetical protein
MPSPKRRQRPPARLGADVTDNKGGARNSRPPGSTQAAPRKPKFALPFRPPWRGGVR